MATLPEVQLEREDNAAFQEMMRSLGQLKRKLSYQIGKPGTSLDDMHAAKSLQVMLGEAPSQARMNLVVAQGQLTREGLMQAAKELEDQSFKVASGFEMFAHKVEENTEESIDEKRKEILQSVEEHRSRVHQAIERLESLTSFTAEVRPSLAPSQGHQHRESENKFTPNSSKAPDDLPP